MKRFFAIALAALLLVMPLLAGCAYQEAGVRVQDVAAPLSGEGLVSESLTPAPSALAPAMGDVFPGELTFYCSCADCNGKYAGITADGTRLNALGPGDTPVAGCNWLPLQSLVEVGGIIYRIADRGGPGLNRVGRLDIFTPEGHATALDAVYTS
jgi:hypothetical protein